MVEAIPSRPLLRVVPESDLQKSIKAAEDMKVAAQASLDDATMTNLASFIRKQYDQFSRHRSTTAGWSERLLVAMRAFKGEYPAEKIAEIRKFGGSEIYSRLIAQKCRGASSLLRDVYLTPDRSWGVDPPADPDIPQNIIDAVRQLVTIEVTTLQQNGQPIDPNAIKTRMEQLMEGARNAEKKQAKKRAELSEDKIDEILVSGGFYKALAEFLVDIPLFPFACIKGPVVRIEAGVEWEGNKPVVKEKPRLTWYRVSPFDLYWTPGASDIEDAAVVERGRITRAELNDLLDLPGYKAEEIRLVLDEYGRGGLTENWDTTDSERAQQENRENPSTNTSGMINYLEFTGNVQGRDLLDWGMSATLIQDPLRDYMVNAWLIGRHVIKVQLSPSPRKRHNYYITSFEKVPGTPVGNGLPDMLHDIQDACNATLRALINNMAMASGPQVVINSDRIAPGENPSDLYPWKRWQMLSDPFGNNTQVPVSFFQPNSNAQELLSVYASFITMADDASAIPKYTTGAGAGAGAGRTASGLAMLMSNASKLLQTVAANIDRDVFDPALRNLFDIILLTDNTGILEGDENVKVMGVNVAIQRETQRARQLEFLQITANPIDMSIVGPKGRATVLRSVSQTIGLDGDEIVPSDGDLDQQQKQSQQNQEAQAQQGRDTQGGQQPNAQSGDMGPRTNLTPGA